MRHLSSLLPGVVALLVAREAHADPWNLRAAGSLRDGLRVEACRGTAPCQTWVRFPARPYRTFVEARMSPSGRFFYVWSTPDGRPRELDVFATPPREGSVANRRGHWSPGAGGALAWAPRDRLWHTWRCGAHCVVAQVYSATGTTLTSLSGEDAERSPDGRYAVVTTDREGQLIDLERDTVRLFRAPEGYHYSNGEVAWTGRRVSVGFDPDDDPSGEARAVSLDLPTDDATQTTATTPTPARPARPIAQRPTAPATPQRQPASAAPHPVVPHPTPAPRVLRHAALTPRPAR